MLLLLERLLCYPIGAVQNRWVVIAVVTVMNIVIIVGHNDSTVEIRIQVFCIDTLATIIVWLRGVIDIIICWVHARIMRTLSWIQMFPSCSLDDWLLVESYVTVQIRSRWIEITVVRVFLWVTVIWKRLLLLKLLVWTMRVLLGKWIIVRIRVVIKVVRLLSELTHLVLLLRLWYGTGLIQMLMGLHIWQKCI